MNPEINNTPQPPTPVIQSKKKKGGVVVAIIIILLIVVAGIYLYFNWNNLFGKKNNDANTVEEQPANEEYKKIENDKDIVYKKYTFNSKCGNLSIELPVINLDYAEIKDLNDDLESTFNMAKATDTTTEDTELGCVGGMNSIGYETYKNGDIISVVLTLTDIKMNAGGFIPKYTVYVIDTKNGNILSTEEIYAVKNTTAAIVKTKMEAAIDTHYEEMKTDTNYSAYIDSFETWKTNTKSDYSDKYLFLNNSGKYVNILKIYSEGINDYQYEEITID